MKRKNCDFFRKRIKEVIKELDCICKMIKRHTLFTVMLVMILFGLLAYLTDENLIYTSGNARKLPIYCVNTDSPKVSLSFDAAWGNEDTKDILEILSKYDVKVTFFMTGEWIEKYPEDVKAIAEAGHDLANHSMNHKEMSKLSNEQCKEEIMKPHQMVKELTGVEMQLFRPPYGDYNNVVVESANEVGYHCVQWDVDSLDWKDYGTESIINTVVNHKHLGNGSIILLHNGAKYTPGALEAVIVGLQEKGYELVPISQLIYTGDYYMDHEGRQFKR